MSLRAPAKQSPVIGRLLRRRFAPPRNDIDLDSGVVTLAARRVFIRPPNIQRVTDILVKVVIFFAHADFP